MIWPRLWKPQVEGQGFWETTKSRGNSTASRLDVFQRSHFLTGLTRLQHLCQKYAPEPSIGLFVVIHNVPNISCLFIFQVHDEREINQQHDNTIQQVRHCIDDRMSVTIPPGHVHGEHLARRILDILWNRRTWGTEPLSQVSYVSYVHPTAQEQKKSARPVRHCGIVNLYGGFRFVMGVPLFIIHWFSWDFPLQTIQR